MKNRLEIANEVEASAALAVFTRTPAVIECWNEHGLIWRDDNGRCYSPKANNEDYIYHLIYFDDRLAIVEVNGITFFSHLSPELEKMMSEDYYVAQEQKSVTKPNNDLLDLPPSVRELVIVGENGNISYTIEAAEKLSRIYDSNKQQ